MPPCRLIERNGISSMDQDLFDGLGDKMIKDKFEIKFQLVSKLN